MCTERSFFTFLEMKRHCEKEHQNDLGIYVTGFERTRLPRTQQEDTLFTITQ